jgi:hypothetical protein
VNVFSLEGQAAGEHFKQHDPQTPNIRAVIDRCGTFGLLRRHVSYRAQHHARLGVHLQFGAGFRVDGSWSFDRLGQTKVEHFHNMVAPHHDVVGLNVSMHDVRFMGRVERCCDLGGNVEHLMQFETVRPQVLAQGHPSTYSVAMKRLVPS